MLHVDNDERYGGPHQGVVVHVLGHQNGGRKADSCKDPRVCSDKKRYEEYNQWAHAVTNAAINDGVPYSEPLEAKHPGKATHLIR